MGGGLRRVEGVEEVWVEGGEIGDRYGYEATRPLRILVMDYVAWNQDGTEGAARGR